MISTLPNERSGWLRSKLIERVRGATSVPVEHVVVDGAAPTRARRPHRGLAMEAASIAHAAVSMPTRPRRTAARASRRRLLGMLLFIISEMMVFGAFFTAYFFIRIAQGEPWPAPGPHCRCRSRRQHGDPRVVLIHRALGAELDQEGNHFALKAGMLTTFLLGCTFLFIQINEYANIGFAPQDHAQETIFYSLTGLHGAHVFIGLTLLLFVTIRAFRGHYIAGGASRRRGAGDLLALRRHHVDRRLHLRLRALARAARAC